MKPIKIEIEGLNSFEENQVLEFDKLGNGVFGIFGNTGSGKSTILDAITLALYGKVERSKQNSDFINIKRQKAIVCLTFEINQNGKTKIYEVYRCFSRKKNGKDIDSTALLYEISSNEKNLIEQSTSKVNDKIYKIIGLGISEFSKCIALPQGEFASFLKSKPSERTEILSKIFSLSKYGDSLSINVKEKINDLEKEIAGLEASKNILSNATDDVLANIQEISKTTKEEYDNTSSLLKEKSEKLASLSEIKELKDNLDDVNKQLNELNLQSQEIDKLKNETTNSQNANLMKNDINNLKKYQIEKENLQNTIASLNETRLQKQSEAMLAGNELSNLEQIFDDKLTELNKKLTVLEEISSSDEEIANLKAEQEKLKLDIDKLKTELFDAQEKDSYLETSLSNLKNEIDIICQEIEKIKPEVEKGYEVEQIKSLENEISLLNSFSSKIENLVDKTNIELQSSTEQYEIAINKEKSYNEKQSKIQKSFKVAFNDEHLSIIEKLRSCDKELLSIEDAENMVSYLRQVIDKLNNDNEIRLENIAKLKINIEKANQILSDYENQLESKTNEINYLSETREEMLGENVISLISDNLKIGDFCPVCSSRVVQKIYSEKNNISEIENELANEKLNKQGMMSIRDELFSDVITLKAKIEFEKLQINSNESEINQINSDIQKIMLNFVNNDGDIESNFLSLKSLIIDSSNKLEELLIIQENLRDELSKIIIEKAQFGSKITTINNYLKDLYEILYDTKKKIAEREFLITSSQASLNEIEDYKKFIAEKKNLEVILDEKNKTKEILKEQLLSLTNEKSNSERNILQIKSNMQIISQKLEGDEKQIASILTKLLSSGVPEGVSIDNEIEITSNAIDSLKNDKQTKQSLYETAKVNLARVENDYNINSKFLVDKENQISNLMTEIDNNLSKFNFIDIEDVEKKYAENVKIKENLDKINNFTNKLTILNEKQTELRNKIAEKPEVNFDEIENLKNDIEGLSEKVNYLSEQVGKNSVILENTSNSNCKLKEVLKSLDEINSKYDTAKELNQVLRGKALAEYICDEYMQEIMFSANQKLDLLMDGRYNLKFENNEFLVEDNFADGIIRSAETLSGGETFVVSLSLALAISDAIAMLSSRTIDFFFLDEGFGTLDNELCQTVISALHKLENEHLKIGLISHVSELAESIKNKVLITKDSKGSKIKIDYSI